MPTGIAATAFSTDSIAADLQYEAWRAVVRDIYETRRDEEHSGFAGRIAAWHLGNMLVTRARAEAQYFSRSDALIASGGLDHILVQVYLGGECRGLYDEVDCVTRRGDIKFIDQARPFTNHNTDFHNITVAMPRQVLAGVVAEPDRLHGRVLPAGGAAATLLGRHIRGLAHCAGEMSQAEAAAASEATRHLVAAAAGATGAAREVARQHAAEATALLVRDFIDANLAAPELTPEWLARRFNLSRAQLYRMFEASGGVAAHIRARRLRGALRALQDPLQGGQPIAAIAYRHGFPNEAHFSRLFRGAFGQSPGEARSAARAEGAVPPAGEDSTGCALRAWFHALG